MNYQINITMKKFIVIIEVLYFVIATTCFIVAIINVIRLLLKY